MESEERQNNYTLIRKTYLQNIHGLYIYIHTYTYTLTHTYIHIHTNIYSQINALTHTRTQRIQI